MDTILYVLLGVILDFRVCKVYIVKVLLGNGKVFK